MSLTRVYASLNNLIIRKFGDVGGPSSSRVDEELNRIIAWAKDAPRNIHRNTTTVGNAGVALTTLHSFSLPANTLATNGDYLKVTYNGTDAATANLKNLIVNFGGQNVETTGAIDIRALGWKAYIEYVRLSATSVLASFSLIAGLVQLDAAAANGGLGFGGRAISRSAALTVADLSANATTLQVQGQGTANNDITQTLSIIELFQQ